MLRRRAVPDSSDGLRSPRAGPTAFVLAGGGTKGSFEVGVLQYLVGVEGIVPDVITATSAGAIAATVLSQARDRDEFADRVAELERDVLAWTHTDQIFGKQPWLGALDGTRLGREIHQELTEGTRPPFPLTPSTMLAGSEIVPPSNSDRRVRRQARKSRRKRQRHILRLLAGAAFRVLPRCAGSCVRAGVPRSTSTRWPTRCATAARTASRPSIPPSSRVRACGCAWPSRRCAPASCASSPRTAPSWRPTPARRWPARPPGRSTSSTGRSPRPVCPWCSRRTRWRTTTTSTAA